jgi:hypothetical protein
MVGGCALGTGLSFGHLAFLMWDGLGLCFALKLGFQSWELGSNRIVDFRGREGYLAKHDEYCINSN